MQSACENILYIVKQIINALCVFQDLFNIQDPGGQQPSSALITLNQMAAGGHQIATVKRRKKSTAAPDKKKMYEEVRVMCYIQKSLNNRDEERTRYRPFPPHVSQMHVNLSYL